MKIFVLGAGRMGAWLVEELCLDYEVAVHDIDRNKLKYFFNVNRFMDVKEAAEFKPDLLVNTVSLQHTIPAFEAVLPYLPKDCIIADITSVKTGLADFYKKAGFRFVSTHPMFGPTFGNIRDLSRESAIIIQESDEFGKELFKRFYRQLKLNIFEYTFDEHDRTIAYSLSVPFASTMVFAACMKKQEAPGTTFMKHMNIAKGLLSEDDYLLSEILLNPYTLEQIEGIKDRLTFLTKALKKRNQQELIDFIQQLRKNIE